MISQFGIGIILLFGLVLRLPQLSGSFWMDEAAQVLESSRSLSEQHLIADDFQPPLLHYALHFLLYVTRSEVGLRSVSVISGLMTIAFVYLIVNKTVGKREALFCSFLIAINPFHIYFSQELRPYSLATMFACISWWSLIGKPKHQGLAFIASTIAGFYSMYIYPFVLLSQVLFIFISRRNELKRLLLWIGIVAAFCLPWLPFFMGQLSTGIGLARSLPGWSQVVGTPIIKSLPLVLAKFIVGPVELKDSPVFYLFAGVSILVMLLGAVKVWGEKKHRYLIYWFLVPVLGSWLLSFFIPVIQPKRVMLALPPMIVIVGIWLLKGAETWRKLIAGFLIGVFLLFTFLYWFRPEYHREDWKGIIANIEQDANVASVALFIFPEPFAPWRWYGSQRVESLAVGSLLVTQNTNLDQALGPVLDYDRVYLFDYLSDLTDPSVMVKQWLKQRGYKETKSLDGGSVGFVRVFDSL